MEQTQPAAAAKPSPRKTSWRAKLLLLAVSLFVTLAICEVFLRLTWVGQWNLPRDARLPGGIFSFRFKPNTDLLMGVADVGNVRVVTNADGFRGPTVSETVKKPLSIVSIGDSLMFSWGLDINQHSMSLFTEDYCKRHPDRDVGHAFISAPARDPRDYYYAYMTLVLPQHPDLIVLGFFPGNDVLPDDTPVYLDPATAPRNDALEAAVKPKFVSLEWAKTQFRSSLFVAKLAIKMGKTPESFARFNKDIDGQKKHWTPTLAYLQALVDQVKAHGSRLVIISWPSMVQVTMAKNVDDAGLDHTMPDKILTEFCAKNQVDFIPLLEPMKAGNTNNDLFFRIDRHPTAQGQHVAAAYLDEKLAPIVDQVWAQKKAATQPATSQAPH